MVYDNYGRQTSLSDPNAGTVTYGYNNFGELTSQTDSRNLTSSLTYDNLGRVHTQVSPEGTKTFAYDPSGNPGLLSSVSFPGGSETYNYDSNSRLTSKVENIDGVNYTTGYGYDGYSRIETITYPSNFAVKNVYNTFGYQVEVRRNDNNALIWQGQNVNAFGQFTQCAYGNNLTNTKSYNSLGMLSNISTGSVQNMDYSFDMEKGNLLSRHDNLRSLTETFSYDDLNRLTGVSGPSSLTMTYSSNGNILSKTSVGDYSYDSPKPHAVTSVTNTDGLIPTTTQRVTLTSFNKVDSIIQGNLVYTLTYGHEDQRTMSRLYDNGVLQKTTYYVGGYEKEVKPGNNIRQIHYITGGDGLAAIFVKNNGVDTLYYVHTDHLGSINVITNQSGAVVKNYSFDAWGRRRNPVDWTYNNIPSTSLFSRGFTGHEHLDLFSLINMNGRVYDPMLGRFLSPDNFVQSTDFTQSFNRYGYCMNNPLRYIDPSGYTWLSHFTGWVGDNWQAIATVAAFVAIAILAPITVAAYWAGSYAINLVGNNMINNHMSLKEAFRQTPFVVGMSFTIPYHENKPPTNNYEDSGSGISDADLDNLGNGGASEAGERTYSLGTIANPMANIIENYQGVMGLTQINYYTNQSFPGQMMIDISYTSSKNIGGNWTQWLTLKSEYSTRSFYDNGNYGQGNSIYYYNDLEIQNMTNGNTIFFHDNPYFARTMSFSSILSLRTPLEGIILTLSYGYSYKSGAPYPNTLYPLKVLYHKY